MEIALIPPIPNLIGTPNTRLHLLLTQLMSDRRYTSFYQRRRMEGDYLIMDNGAHEFGAAQGHEMILNYSKTVRAQELVMPDVLFDRRGTVERTKRMLKWVCGPGIQQYLSAGKPRLMMVPQGSDKSEWVTCLHHLFTTWNKFADYSLLEHPVIGISKDYDEWRGGLVSLVQEYVQPARNHQTFDVHCLGWPRNLWTIAKLAREFPWIRSTDSAKPFVYAKHKILLEPGGVIPQYPKRDNGYFTHGLQGEEWEIAKRNVLVYNATASDDIIINA